jgi:hypothetical protein
MAIRRLAVALTILCSMGCVDQDSALPVPPSPPAPIVSVPQVVGCYRHTEQSLIFARPPWSPPRTFYLTGELVAVTLLDCWSVPPWSAGDCRPVARWKARRADNYPAYYGTWQLTNQNTIQVSWNDIQATLRRGSTDDLWRGKMESSSDDGRVYPGPGISVRRVDDAVCDPKAL